MSALVRLYVPCLTAHRSSTLLWMLILVLHELLTVYGWTPKIVFSLIMKWSH